MKTNSHGNRFHGVAFRPPTHADTPAPGRHIPNRRAPGLKRNQGRGLVGALAVLCLTAAVSLPAQTMTQTFSLRPGWNAIYLEVAPADPAPSAVFTNLPLASAWTHAERLTSVAFIQDPSEEAFNQAGWLGWFPGDRPEGFLTSLYAGQANRAYLIKIEGSAPATLTVTGRPSLRQSAWVPDAYNLRGFPVADTSPPTFLNYFRTASAHYNSTAGTLEKIYRLNQTGQWVTVAPSDLMKRGEACWVFSRGASDFTAPIEVRPDLGDGVDFNVATEEFSVEIRNRSAANQSVGVKLSAATVPGALAYRIFNPAQGGYQWPNLPASTTFSVAAGATHRLRLAIRRGAFSASSYSALLEITDGAGSRFWVPVSAQKPAVPGAFAGANPGPGVQGSPLPDPNPLRGLWVGSVGVKAVNEVNSANPTNVTPVPTEFPLRILLHVDGSGQARFLKEVIQMWRDGTYTNDATGAKVVDKPGEYVFLTDDRLIGQFKGATLRDGTPVGRRLSTAGFDFDGGATNYLPMTGAFAVGNRLNVSIALGPNFPTNPFRHKYHPDHDNLDARFVALTNNFEAYPVTRQIELEFTSTDPTGTSSPDYGYSVMGGIYRETLSGLHRNPIRLQGNFRLTRAAFIDELNPSPTP